MEEHGNMLGYLMFQGVVAWLWFVAGMSYEGFRRSRRESNGEIEGP